MATVRIRLHDVSALDLTRFAGADDGSAKAIVVSDRPSKTQRDYERAVELMRLPHSLPMRRVHVDALLTSLAKGELQPREDRQPHHNADMAAIEMDECPGSTSTRPEAGKDNETARLILDRSGTTPSSFVQVMSSNAIHWKLFTGSSKTCELRRRLLKFAVAAFVGGPSGTAASGVFSADNDDDDDVRDGAAAPTTSAEAAGSAASVKDIEQAAAARPSVFLIVDDRPWDAAVMDAVAFAVPVRAPLTGDIAVMDVLQRCLLWLPPEQRALLAVSGVSRGWRAAAERLPQWCLVPQLRFVSEALDDMVLRVPDDNSEIDEDNDGHAGVVAAAAPLVECRPLNDRKNARTRTAYVAVMQQRREAHQARFEELKAMLGAERRTSNWFLPVMGAVCAIGFLAIIAVGWSVSSAAASHWSTGVADTFAFFVNLILAVVLAVGFVCAAHRLCDPLFAHVTDASARLKNRGLFIMAASFGVAVHATVHISLVANRAAQWRDVEAASALGRGCGSHGGDGDHRPTFVGATNIGAWTVAPWADRGTKRSKPWTHEPLAARDVTRGSVGPLAPHNESLFRSLCDADALAAAEGPKWLARRLSTPAGIRALINDTHQCNDVFTDLSATGLGLMQPPPPLHRFVWMVPPVAHEEQHSPCTPLPIALLVPEADDAAMRFTALMRRIATGGSASTTSSGVDATASAAPAGTVEGGEVTLLRSAWSTLLSPIRDDDTASAGQQWFNASRRPVPWASRYTDSDSLTRRAVAALSLADADEAEALFNRSRGHPQPLTLYGGVLADSERAPWWLEPPDGHAGAASLWRAEGVPLVIGIADEAPAQQRAWFVTRAFIITGVGVAAIAAATAASMLPEHRLGSAALEMLAMTVLFVTVNPAWLLALAVGCKAAENNPAYCFMSDTVTGACVLAGVLFGVLHTSVFCLEACRLRGSR